MRHAVCLVNILVGYCSGEAEDRECGPVRVKQTYGNVYAETSVILIVGIKSVTLVGREVDCDETKT